MMNVFFVDNQMKESKMKTYAYTISNEAGIIKSLATTHDQIIQEIDKVRWEISRVYGFSLEKVTADLRAKTLF